MKIAILGGGSWGTALSVHLAKNNHKIKVWEFFEEQATEMQQKRVCKLLPEITLPKNIFVSSKMEEVLTDSELVLLVVPSDKAESTISNASKYLKKQPIIICSKGFAKGLKLLSGIIKQKTNNETYCLYGPTHAEEVCKGMFSCIVLAGGEGKEQLKQIIESKNLKVELSDDIIGIQVAATLKNIIAIFSGILSGLGMGSNLRAYIITKGMHEIKEVGLKMGAKEETFYGLAGIGDIIVTCFSKYSRNHYVGEQVGKGKKLKEVIDEMNMIAEGVVTVKLIPKLKTQFGLKLPLLTCVYDILIEGNDPKEVLKRI